MIYRLNYIIPEKTMIPITTGDIMPIYGSFGLGIRYTIRFVIRLTDRIDENILSAAATKTQQRYPYLSLRLRRGRKDYCFEENPAPIAVINTDKRIYLNSKDTISAGNSCLTAKMLLLKLR